MASALDGIRVIDLTRHRAGALATMFLSDHGADVVRVIDDKAQLHRGDGFRVWDRGKTVILDATGDATQLEQLIKAADVIVEDCAPGKRPDHLQWHTLAHFNPRIVACSITAYGEHGPLRDHPQIDDLVLARTGILSGLPAFRGAPPVHCIHPLPSAGAGVLAALAVASGLYARERTGRGRHVSTSLVAGALLYHPKVLSDHLAPHVFQTNPFGSAPFYSVYECSDQEWIQLGCVHPGFIARAADLMGLGDIIKDPVYGQGLNPQTPEADAYLRKRVTEVMLTRTAADWSSDFEANDIPFARSQTSDDGMDDQQVRHNDMVVALNDPELGEIQQMGVPVKLSATPGKVPHPRAAQSSATVDWSTQSAEQATPQDRDNNLQLPLSGVRVLEITNLIAGPMAGRLLTDLGADVMKLEPPTGDISRPIGRTYFYSVNYGKRSIAVDTSKPEGKEIVRKIAATCDAMLANLRPGATARMGIGNAVDDNLIEAQISGYGFTGPYAHRPGIDPLAQAYMGLERAQGGQGNPPSFPAQLAPTDFTTGTMTAFGIVLSMFARARGNAKGQRVEVNLLDGGILLSSEWFTRYASRPQRELADKQQFGPNPFHRIYQTADGFIYVAADSQVEQAAMLTALSCEELDVAMLARSDDGHPNDSAAAQQLATRFASLTNPEAEEKLIAAGVPCAPVAAAESEAFFSDPMSKLNGWAVTKPHATAGMLTAVCRYIGQGDFQDGNILPTPLLGEQNWEILRESGLSDDDIAQLQRDELITHENPPT
ncbi:MAG: CoA transferase, partial [Pseudomonadota bacterium]